MLGFGDSTTIKSSPGWPLRNFLILAAKQWLVFLFHDTVKDSFFRAKCLKSVDVLCYRDYTREGKRVNSHSLIIKGVELQDITCKFNSLSMISIIVTIIR